MQKDLEVEMLKVQNALILQRIDKTKYESEIKELVQKSDFYEELYNKTKADMYELEQRLSKFTSTIETELEDEIFSNNCKNVDSIGIFGLVTIILKRLKKRLFWRRE